MPSVHLRKVFMRTDPWRPFHGRGLDCFHGVVHAREIQGIVRVTVVARGENRSSRIGIDVHALHRL